MSPAADAGEFRLTSLVAAFDVYISSELSAKSVAQYLLRRLEEQGLQVFAPFASISHGANWDEAIRDAIATAKSFVVVLTPTSTRVPSMEAELATLVAIAQSEEAPIFPLALGDTPTPRILRHLLTTRVGVPADGLTLEAPDLDAFAAQIVNALKARESPAIALQGSSTETAEQRGSERHSMLEAEVAPLQWQAAFQYGAAAAFEQDGNLAAAAAAYSALGDLHIRVGDLAEAEAVLHVALRLGRKTGSPVNTAGPHRQLGILAQARGDYAEAERQYQQALQVNEQVGDVAGLVDSRHRLGVLAQARGDYAEAERQYRQALQINEQSGDITALADVYHQLGVLAQARGSYAGAERQYRQALQINEQAGGAGAADTYQQLGLVAQARGDYEQAEQQYRQALQINERLGNVAALAGTYHQLGVLAQARGEYEQAEHQYRQALQINEQIGNVAATAVTLYQLGLLASEQDELDTATLLLIRAEEVSTAVSDREGAAAAMTALGQLLTRRGHFEEAVEWNYRALLLRQRLGRSDTSTDLQWLSRQQRQLGNERFGQLLQGGEFDQLESP